MFKVIKGTELPFLDASDAGKTFFCLMIRFPFGTTLIQKHLECQMDIFIKGNKGQLLKGLGM